METKRPDNLDYALMTAMAGGDRDALAKFYDRHAGLVFSVCLRVLRDRSAAEETLLDIFQELWRKADRYDPSRGSPLTFLVTLSRNRAIDRKRVRKLSSSSIGLDEAMLAGLSKPDGADDPAALSETDEQRKLVREALKQLEPGQRQVIELSYFDGLSHSEIAQQTAKPLGTVKTSIRSAIAKLRDAMRVPNVKTVKSESRSST